MMRKGASNKIQMNRGVSSILNFPSVSGNIGKVYIGCRSDWIQGQGWGNRANGSLHVAPISTKNKNGIK